MSAHPASRWYFSAKQLEDTPSAQAGLAKEKELSYRQQAANFIQDMGQRLQVTQLCINTAIVYMQRFYMFHAFNRFHRNTLSAAALFLAAKVEEQPRKLEHVIKVAYICLHREPLSVDSKNDLYLEQTQELVSNENILLQTLGFDVAIDHPHTHVVRCCQLVKASKELAQTSYFMATNSLHLTTMCLRFPPTIVACVCIHLACKWSHYKIPVSAEGKRWFSYVDPEATFEQLEQLTDEFLTIFDRCPSRLKKKIKASSQATREEEDRRARGDIAASSYQLDLSIRPASSSTTTGNHAQQQHQQPSQPPGMHSQQHPGHGKHGQKSGGGSSFSSSSSGKSGQHHHQHQQHAMGGHPQRPPNAGSGPPGSSASGQSRPDKMHTSGSSSQQRPPPQSSDPHKRQTMDPAQYEEYKRRKMAEQQQAQMAAAKGGVSSQPGISMPSSGGQGQRPHSGSSAARPHPGQQQQHPPSSQRPGSHPGSNMMKTHPSGQHHHHHHQQQQQQLSSSSSKPQPPSMMLPLAGDPSMPPGQTVLSSSQGSTGHRKSMPGGGPHGPKLPSANMANEPSKRLSLPHNHQKPMARPAGPPMPTSMGHNTKPPQPNSHRPQAAFQSHPQSSGGPQKQPHPQQQQQQQPPLPPTSVASRPSAPPPPSSSAPPKRSIFDIDLAESPIRDPGLNTLLEPINSPANLSDVSDLELREHAADVSLEPGEILDTPDVNGSLAHLGFTFPSLPTKDKDPKASQVAAQRPKAEPKSSPVKQVRNPAEVKKSSPTKSLFSNSRDPDQMTKSLIKPEPTTSIFGLANMKKGSPSPQKAPKSDLKRPSQTSSLFSPNSDSGNSDGPALKIPKLEETPGYEKLRDGRQTIRVAKEDRSGLPVPPKEMIVSIPWNQQEMGDGSASTSASTNSLFQEDKKSSSSPSGEREHKEKKKKKKEKKEKKDKKDKDKDRSERKHKKHKDKDRERSSKEQPSSATSSPMVSGSSGTGIKLKIKVGRESNWDNAPPPPGPAGETIAPLKINLMGDSGKKRPRQASDSDSQQGPATKMSRALGTNVLLEDSYFTDIKRSKH